MKRFWKTVLLWALSLCVAVSGSPVLAAENTCTVTVTETILEKDSGIHKLTIAVRGYSNTIALDLALAYRSDSIAPIDAAAFAQTGRVSQMESLTAASLTALGETPFLLQTSREVTLADGRKALSIAAYTSDAQGWDLSTQTNIFEVYYRVCGEGERFSIADSDEDLLAVYGSVNGAGVTIVSKDGATACYCPHSESTIYTAAEEMKAPVFVAPDSGDNGGNEGGGSEGGGSEGGGNEGGGNEGGGNEGGGNEGGGNEGGGSEGGGSEGGGSEDGGNEDGGNEGEKVLPGDVNGDGKVNGTDTNLIFRHVSGTLKLKEVQLIAADVNDDDKVNGTDTNLVFRYVSGTLESFE